MLVRRHAPQHCGEKLEPNPKLWLQHKVDRSLGQIADQHLLLADRCHCQLDEPGFGREGHEIEGFAGPLGEVFHDGEDQAIVDVEGQFERPLEYCFLSVLVASLVV
jgi:hypothetical protein